MKVTTAAILGGGIMGCSTALEFARRGVRSVVFEAAEDLFSGASRWNEGKIHLGHLYSADPTLQTAMKVLPGGLQFRSLVEQLIATSLAPVITQSDDLYLCHARSVVPPEAMQSYFHRVDDLVRDAHPQSGDYLADLRSASSRRIDQDTLRTISSSEDIVAGFVVPERSVDTNWIADRFVAAVRASEHIEVRTNSRVIGVSEVAERNHVITAGGREGPFDVVVNALWQGRIAIDKTVPLPLPPEWLHRYRLSLFIRTRTPVRLPSAVIAAGPFGDLKNYNDRNFYLSWYPTGLIMESRELQPPDIPPSSPEFASNIASGVFENLERYVPGVREIAENVERLDVAGGWVYASASGSLADPLASLHRRKDFGVVRHRGYVSVDTGKYSTAPWLARMLVREVLGET